MFKQIQDKKGFNVTVFNEIQFLICPFLQKYQDYPDTWLVMYCLSDQNLYVTTQGASLFLVM